MKHREFQALKRAAKISRRPLARRGNKPESVPALERQIAAYTAKLALINADLNDRVFSVHCAVLRAGRRGQVLALMLRKLRVRLAQAHRAPS